ncbi:MAG: PEP-CTERM sorting domain-containing protein [Syntrophotaleaceae bacterium]
MNKFYFTSNLEDGLMSKKWFALMLFVAAMMVLSVGQASALMIKGHDYELLEDVNPVGAPSFTVGKDLGYFVWTDDELRRDWHVRWSGDTKVTPGALYLFSGNVALSANQFDDVATFKFETSGTYKDTLIETADQLNYFAFANVGQDGFDFSIIGDLRPSFLGFDLNITAMPGTDASEIQNFIQIGADMVNPESGDFAMAAPVPEPGTLLLLGGGLIGLVYLRKRNKA